MDSIERQAFEEEVQRSRNDPYLTARERRAVQQLYYSDDVFAEEKIWALRRRSMMRERDRLLYPYTR